MPTIQAISLSTNSFTDSTIVVPLGNNRVISPIHSMTIMVINPTIAKAVNAPAGPAVSRAFPLFAYMLVPIILPIAMNCEIRQHGLVVWPQGLTKICQPFRIRLDTVIISIVMQS
jgi:hypothetical protein